MFQSPPTSIYIYIIHILPIYSPYIIIHITFLCMLVPVTTNQTFKGTSTYTSRMALAATHFTSSPGTSLVSLGCHGVTSRDFTTQTKGMSTGLHKQQVSLKQNGKSIQREMGNISKTKWEIYIFKTCESIDHLNHLRCSASHDLPVHLWESRKYLLTQTNLANAINWNQH